jgi:hypothetical protein
MPFLNDLIAKPFRYGGSVSDVFGCYSLAREVLRRFGIPLPYVDTSDFSNAHDEIMRFAIASRIYPTRLTVKPPEIIKSDGTVMTWKDLASTKVLVYVYQDDNWTEIQKPEEAALAVFNARVLKTNIPHLGVFLNEDEFIHSNPPHGVRKEVLATSFWRGPLCGIFKYIGPRLDNDLHS